MHRYRINHRLLGVIFLGCIVVPPPLYFIWKYQVDSNANWFESRAEEALEAGDIRKAAEDYTKYVQLRPKEDDVRIKLALVSYDITELIDVSREELSRSYAVVESAVRNTNDPGLRRKLIDLQLKFNRSQDAIVQIEELLLIRPDDHELKSLRAKCLFLSKNFEEGTKYSLQLIGYDKVTDEFNTENAEAKDYPEVYSALANALNSRENNLEFAERVIQQMVSVNPDSHVAHLQHSVFLRNTGKKEESKEALDRAYELDPTDVDVQFQKGNQAFLDGDYEEASRIYAAALKENPKLPIFYDRLARAEAAREQFDEAIATLDRGISLFKLSRATELAKLKINLLVAQQDLPAVEKQLHELTGLNIPQLNPWIDFQRARVLAVQGKWSQAARALKEVSPKLHAYRAEQSQAGGMLAQCYERLGKPDLALKYYNSVLQEQPDNQTAQQGRNRLRAQLRLGDEGSSSGLDAMVSKMLDQPAHLQDWNSIDEFIEQLSAERDLPEARKNLLKANILIRREKFSEAQKLITEAFQLDPNDLGVAVAAIRLTQREPEGGPAKAMELLDKKVADLGDNVDLRALRADLLMGVGSKQLAQELQALTEDMDEWSDRAQAHIWKSVGAKFHELKMLERTYDCWAKAAELLPNDLPTQTHLFEFALAQGNDEAMRKAQSRILTIVDEKDSTYILTEVKRRIAGLDKGIVTKDELSDARQMLDEALLQRPNWHAAHVLYGQLLVFLKGDADLALKHFEEALEYGPANVNALPLHLKLLVDRNRFADASKVLKMLPEAFRNQSLGHLTADILLETGEKEAAFEAAKQYADQRSGDAKTQIWFAQIASSVDRPQEAEAAVRLAIKTNPYEASNWITLLRLNLDQRDGKAVQRTLREATLALDAEYLPLLTAKYFELGGKWRDAERLYLAMYNSRLGEIGVARKLASFYLLWVREDVANTRKAAPYINLILKAANEGRVAKDHKDVVWARRQAARLLAATNDYRNAMQARKLLERGASKGKLSSADRSLIAEILFSQRNPQSRLDAIALLSDLLVEHRIDKKEELQLAKFQYEVGQWKDSESLMLDMLSRYGSDPEIWVAYMNMLIDRGDYKKARRRLSRLEELQPTGPSLIQLKARLMAAEGDKEQLRSFLTKLLPQDLRNINAQQLGTVLNVANFAAQLGDVEFADQLYRLYVRQVPEQKRLLISFLASYGDCDEALTELKRMGDQRTAADLQVALNILRNRRKEFGDKYDEEVLRMLRAAIREDPDAAVLQQMSAEALEIVGNFEECLQVYEKLLQRDDLLPKVLAATSNNLAFLYAMKGQQLDEAEQLIEHATEILGPISEILDTRAIIRMAQGKYDLATRDLTLAVMVNPNAVKYFHLTQAQLLVGDSQAAIRAWDEAVRLGLLEKNELHLLEQERFQQVKEQIEGLKLQSAEL